VIRPVAAVTVAAVVAGVALAVPSFADPGGSSPAPLVTSAPSDLSSGVRAAAEEARAERERRAEQRRREQERAARAAARAAADLVGVQPSLYRGGYYDTRYESTRRCIVERESEGQYSVVSSNGTWHGAYQFARGTSDIAARRMDRPDLVGVPASQWDRAEQDEAFWTMWDHGRGAGHWAGGRWSC
jgi:hypothetical protein